ncbi:hypothetical protein G5714_021467 [Onychostoma macrolepis]|uniref:Uncharacterized protein n=1 Tax=Onychostoma macrolepis TaxID=369639 RepID=A0A7J6BR14_9TELE|nr:hypothetical protein G5714_021467 [Onychostoma macrolepis]
MSLPEEERSGSHVFSSVSAKSDWSHELNPPNLSEKTPSSPTKSVRSASHLFSSVSLKSDHSKKDTNFREKTPSSPTKSVRSGSHVFSSVSVKSDQSMFQPPQKFREETLSSAKSYKGQKTTVNIGAEYTRWQTLKAQKGLKSDVELATFLLNRVQYEKSDSEFQTYRLRKEFSENRLWIFQDLENKIIVFLKNELEKLKKILQKENTQYFVQDFNEGMCSIKEAALDITLYFLREMKQDKLADTLEALGTNPLLLKELDLSEDKLGDLDGEKLSALLMDSHSKVEKMKLNNCELTEKSCSVLATVLSSKTILKEMNLNNSRLLDSGVKEICEGLKNPVCELKILKLSNCGITEEGYKALASALRSNPSHLIELDLTGNDPGQSGVKELIDLLQDPNCQLKTLRFLGSAADEACRYVTGIVGKNPLLLRVLNLSEHELGDSNVNRLAVLLQDKHCQLNTLILNDCGITDVACLAQPLAKTKALHFLKELDLKKNKIGNSKKQLSKVLKDSNCNLSLDSEQRLFRAGLNHVGGWFTL